MTSSFPISPSRHLPMMLALLALTVLPARPAGAAPAETTFSATFGPGVQEFQVQDDQTDRPLAGHIWYPTPTPNHAPRADRSKVWQMAPADPGAEVADGTYPLLVVSHGMFGNTFNQAWLGSELARHGHVVAMVNHPGTSSFLRDPLQAQQLWERPKDLSRLITHLTERSTWRDFIDQSRVSAAGHSLGGFTVMLAGGARFDGDLYDKGCFGDTRIPVVCDILRGWSVAETPEDRRAMEQNLRDSRIRKIISLDLGGAPVLSRSSLSSVAIPVLVLGAGRADMLDQDLESRALASALPKALTVHIELEDAGHFDFMGVCKPEGFAILQEHEPGDEMVCVKGGADRELQHQRILNEILMFLEN
ncbi:alpha/beta hydrolase family protein [Roseibium alexandrii]|uniref:Putative dienelactone hydrolase n=1 Tax=Roseibium alexandrii (strain DSM 17067 / NCIMB 14079 / DFL-11) TaxID=244592 RepID=A0A5E8H2N1_ROSAD|nr:lipoprotein signal peptide [Roseibium alexandrii]EEE46136.2 putative dienelactone hydrolase [Roseibium alexandrii DFL-11]